ncbi:MAG: Mur ligase family protein [Thermus sp.]|uniref:UDP-N-acetylmuramoyl-tripeptide--D-alanyl-D- alanine ligase n=1 Tax=Thermus sp. TaxID=275 RepID=UPI0025ED1FB6|nr:Mur ligase family protein [Thermus sp.]MCS6869174.1 Mur ligase family protein [Thermus sp.]MCS7219062.1 Mur ligase family protein [Thermus sp.]MDW8017397.1 Mur ligase family protein [Thermus sp.]MDW8357317.1 Mur ligase family protein [Thermus sp.]
MLKGGERLVHLAQVRELTPEWVAEATGGRLHPGGKPVRDLHWDSREIGPRSLFVALPGTRVHGRAFAEEARARGAHLVLSDRPGPATVEVADTAQALLRLGGALRGLFPGLVVAVGGSSGKTTTKEALAQGLGFPAPPGNQNTAPPLARFFLHLDPKAEGAVVELGVDRKGEMAELMALAQPHLGVLTALGEEHLQALGSLEGVVAEESGLLQAPQVLVSLQAAEVLGAFGLGGGWPTYGFGQATFPGHDLSLLPEESRFRYGGLEVRVPYPGLGPALGALAALAVADLLGRDPKEVAERLEGLRLPPGRMERREKEGVVFLHDAYNANPLSVKAGLAWLAAQPGRKWAVLGEMRELGEEAFRLHLEVAEEAARLGLRPLYLGSYAPAQAALGGEAAGSLEEALAWLKARVKPGDLVYLKASRALGLERILDLWDA